MSSHVHLVASRGEKDLGEMRGRFKSVTAKKLLKLIEEHPQESRKEWLLYLFKYFSKNKKQYDEYHFWHYTNRPVELYSNAVIDQKVDYIHNNPVVAGIVTEPQYYKWSSANPDSMLKVYHYDIIGRMPIDSSRSRDASEGEGDETGFKGLKIFYN